MPKYTLTHLSDAVLLHDLVALVSRDRATIAELLAHLAEVDARRLYAPAGYPSMFAYCVEELRLSEDAAYRRIRAARAARQFPALFSAIEEGRLHLAAVSLLAPHLTSENVQELIEAATYRRKVELEEFIARRFPAWSLPPRGINSIRPFPQLGSGLERVNGGSLLQNLLGVEPPTLGGDTSKEHLARGQAVSGTTTGRESGREEPIPTRAGGLFDQGTGSRNDELVPGRVASPNPESPPRPERYLVQVTIPKSTHDKLRRIQALLSHAVPSGDVAQVLDRAFDVLLDKLERRKIGRSHRMGRPRARSSRPLVRKRYIPSHVRRAVWERDQGQCTFVNKAGHRCTAKRFLEFDHVPPVARGGTSTIDGLRLRCRAHNQLEAERAFGSGFMTEKRAQSRRDRAQARLSAEARGPVEAQTAVARPGTASEPERGPSRGPHCGSS